MQPDRVVSELELVALAHEHTERPVAVALIGERLRKPPAQDSDSSVQLADPIQRAHGRRCQLWLNPHAEELAFDPLGTPLVELTAVLCEALRVAAVVEDPLLLQLGYGCLDRVWLHSFPCEISPYLGDRPVAPRQEPVAELDRVLDACLWIQRPLGSGQAAFSSTSTSASFSGAAPLLPATDSMGTTRSRSTPTAS
jgi:hypothetical protein